MRATPDFDERLLILAPTGRDARLAADMLQRAGVECQICQGFSELLTELDAGAGALLVAEEALGPRVREALIDRLRQQPSWSDVPIILITSARETELVSVQAVNSLEPLGNVTLLERPVRVVAMVTAVNTALRARRRQYEVRDYLAERQRIDAEHQRLLSAEQAARAEWEAANRAKDEFLAVLSHELRTPLQSVLGWVKILRTGELNATTTTRALAAIERSTRAQTQLIEDLLDISRIVAGKLRVDLKPTTVAPAVEAAVEAVRAAADAKSLTIDTMFDTEPGEVMGDPMRLQQVVWNLLANAVKFTPDGGRIGVSLRSTESQVTVTVSDTGCGIRPAMQAHLFQRFRQADSTHTRAHGGLGLGLAIVRHLVEVHGGTIRVESEGEGRGATFTVTLPRRAARGESPIDAPAETPAASTTPSLDGLSILVVDDDAATREILSVMLEGAGAHVRAAASVDQALGTAQWLWPDVLVSDISMPGEDGYTLVRKLRALERGRRPRIRAIAVTAHARPEDTEQAFVAGFDAHLAKPVEPSELVTEIASLVGRAGSLPRRTGARRWPMLSA